MPVFIPFSNSTLKLFVTKSNRRAAAVAISELTIVARVTDITANISLLSFLFLLPLN